MKTSKSKLDVRAQLPLSPFSNYSSSHGVTSNPSHLISTTTMDASAEPLPVAQASPQDAVAETEAPQDSKPATSESGTHTPITNSIPLSLSAGADPWADPVVSIPDEAPRPAAGGNPWSNTDDDAGGFAGSSAALSPGLNAATSALSVEDYGLVKLGHEARKYWAFKEGYTNLNNGKFCARKASCMRSYCCKADACSTLAGSFGACPKPVLEAFKALNDKAEETPDVSYTMSFL